VCGKGKYFDSIGAVTNRYMSYEFSAHNFFKRDSVIAMIDLYKLYKSYGSKDVTLIANDPISSIINRITARLAGIKRIVYFCHGMMFAPHDNVFRKVAFAAVELLGLVFTSEVIVMNSYDYFFARMFKYSKVKKVYGVGVDVASYKATREVFAGEIVRTVFIGRLIERKGVTYYLDSIKRLDNHKYEHYVIGDGPLASYVISQSINNSNIKYLGYVENISQVISDFDILVFPTLYNEGLPRVVLEGMSASRIVIATDVRGCKDIIINGKNGFLVPCKRRLLASCVADLITSICSDMNRAKQIALQARKTIEQQYSIENIKKQYESIFGY